MALSPFHALNETAGTASVIILLAARNSFKKGASYHRIRDMNEHRLHLTHYLNGYGLEIGALNSPLPLPKNAQAIYSDVLTPGQIDRMYPGSRHPDIISNSEEFPDTPTNTFDFVVANHVLEHVTDPIRALGEWHRILKDGGILFLAIPDKRYTFDRRRRRTSLAHLVEDHRSALPEQQRNLKHLHEWATYVEKLPEESPQWNAWVDDQILNGYCVHNHVWTMDDILDLVGYMKDDGGVRYSVVDYENTPFTAIEFVLILRACKRSSSPVESDREQRIVRRIRTLAALKAFVRPILIGPAQAVKPLVEFVQSRF
jgi:SAM-dependent methyltransferase